MENSLHDAGMWSSKLAVVPHVIPVTAGLHGVQEGPEGRVRNTAVAQGLPEGSGKQVFYQLG